MLKKVIDYVDYDGNSRSEEAYFNISRPEALNWTTEIIGDEAISEDDTRDLETVLMEVVKTKSGKKIMDIFESLILKSYGKKSPDGRRFIKSKELSEEFRQTEAYSELFTELVTNADAAAAFVKGIVGPAAKKANTPIPVPTSTN